MREVGSAARRAIADDSDTPNALAALARSIPFAPSFKSDPSLREIILGLTSAAGLERGIPLYVSIYPSDGAIADTARFVLANLSLVDTKASRLLHVQSLPAEDRRDAVLASAAMPFLFDAREIQGRRWSDGALGGWRSQQGQIPAREFCERVSLSDLYVLHCSDGSLWDRNDVELQPLVYEVRPSQLLGSENLIDDHFDAGGDTINQRLRQGYEDCRTLLDRIDGSIERFDSAQEARRVRQLAIEELKKS